jgi:hypothetical protein
LVSKIPDRGAGCNNWRHAALSQGKDVPSRKCVITGIRAIGRRVAIIFDMNQKERTSVDDELEALRKRSAELIAEVARINERIDELAKSKDGTPPTVDPAICDTWIAPKKGE